MNKIVIIINGKGGVGKDTLCDFAAKKYKVKNVSSITRVKEVAKEAGWDGEKDQRGRKLLSDLKRVLVEYGDLPTRYLIDYYEDFLKDNNEIMFVHIREPEEIEKLIKTINSAECKTQVITLLVRRTEIENTNYGNSSDDDVLSFAYDYEYHNDNSLEDTEIDFLAFLSDIIESNLS